MKAEQAAWSRERLDPLNEQVFAVFYTEYDGMGTAQDAFLSFRRDFFKVGGRSLRLKKQAIIKGFPGKIRGKMTSHSLDWKISLGAVNIEETYQTQNGYVLVKRAYNKSILSKCYFDKGHKWQKSEYFQPGGADNSVPRIILTPVEWRIKVELRELDKKSQSYTATTLYPSKYFEMSPYQNVVDTLYGKPVLMVYGESGTYCYCTQDIIQKRLVAIEEINQSPILTAEEWEKNSGGESPSVAGKSKNKGQPGKSALQAEKNSEEREAEKTEIDFTDMEHAPSFKEDKDPEKSKGNKMTEGDKSAAETAENADAAVSELNPAEKIESGVSEKKVQQDAETSAGKSQQENSKESDNIDEAEKTEFPKLNKAVVTYADRNVKPIMIIEETAKEPKASEKTESQAGKKSHDKPAEKQNPGLKPETQAKPEVKFEKQQKPKTQTEEKPKAKPETAAEVKRQPKGKAGVKTAAAQVGRIDVNPKPEPKVKPASKPFASAKTAPVFTAAAAHGNEPMRWAKISKDGKPDSVPKAKKSDAEILSGSTVEKNNIKEGYNRIENNGVTVYEGDMSDGKRDGFGSYYYRDGMLCYTGFWADGKKEGLGVSFRHEDKALHVANWHNGQPVGFVSLFDSKGNFKYGGKMIDGKKDGAGVSYDRNDGILAVKKWDNGEDTGYSSIFREDGTLIYTGMWSDDKREGNGTSFDEQGDILFTGEWKDGQEYKGIFFKKPEDKK